MRIDLLQLLRRLLGILSAAAAVAETIQGVIGKPEKGQRVGDQAVQQLRSSVGLPSSEPASRPAGQPAAPIGTGVQVPASGPAPGETVTR